MHDDGGTRSWHRSSASINGNCLEFARDGRAVLVRDSKTPDGEPLHFSRESWNRFVRAAIAGAWGPQTG